MHPTETTLLALVHRELSGARLEEVLAHMEHCADCEAKACAQLRADQEIAALLGHLDHPAPALRPPVAPRASRAGRRLRRAAIAASLAALSAAAAAAAVPGTHVHEWLRRHLPGAMHQAGAAAQPVAPPRESVGGVTIPAATDLTIVFRQPQDTGALTLGVAAGPDATLRSWGGQVAYEISDGRIAVDNRRAALRYALELPPTVARLTVMLGDRVVFRGRGPQPGGAGAADSARYSIPLTNP